MFSDRRLVFPVWLVALAAASVLLTAAQQKQEGQATWCPSMTEWLCVSFNARHRVPFEANEDEGIGIEVHEDPDPNCLVLAIYFSDKCTDAEVKSAARGYRELLESHVKRYGCEKWLVFKEKFFNVDAGRGSFTPLMRFQP
jgi:hypothetical protein